jgi:hypothetical protein
MVRLIAVRRSGSIMANPLVWPRNYVVNHQGDAWACWSAVLEAVTTFYIGARYVAGQWKPTKETIYQEYLAAGGPSSQPGSAGDLEKALKVTGHFAGYQRATSGTNNRLHFLPTDRNFQTIKLEIDSGHPVVCVLKYHDHAPRHCVLVYGYTDGATKMVRVADPYPGQTSRDDWDFTEFCTNYRNMAHWSEVGLTQPNEFANLRSLFD